MKTPKSKISLTPGVFRNLHSNIKQNMKAPKLGGGQGIPAPAAIAKALGVNIGMPIHQQMAAKLLNHPNSDVAAAAKKLMARY